MICSWPMKQLSPLRGFTNIFILKLGLLLALASCGGNPDVTLGGAAGGDDTQGIQSGENFQIGASWSAKPLTISSVQEENNFVIARLASNAVKVSTIFAKGTGFYLGRHNGNHIVATNAHVLKNIPSCSVSPVILQFSVFNAAFSCSKIIGIWRDIDFALISLETNSGNEAFLDEINPLKMAFNKDIQRDALVYSAGFGQYRNSNSQLTLKNDEDCRVYSPTNVFARLQDPTRLGSKKVASFAIGCDISPGDSGSPIIERDTGDVLGIVWSTQMPKPITIRSQTYMQDLRRRDTDSVWKHLSYAVPASEIRAELLRWTEKVRRSRPTQKRRDTVSSLLGLLP